MIITLTLCSIAIIVLSTFLYKAHQKLNRFSMLIPLDEQKIQIEKEIRDLKEKMEDENKKLLNEKKIIIQSKSVELDNLLKRITSVELELKEKIEKETRKLLDEKQIAIENKSLELTSLINKINAENLHVKSLSASIEKLEREKRELEIVEDLIESSFYSPKYNFLKSDQYKEQLDQIKNRQKNLISNKNAIRCDVAWTVSGSEKEGQRMTNQNIKLGLASYNGQVDNIILTVTYKNIERSEEKINKIKDVINKMMDSNKCYVTNEYHKLKIEELYLSYEYEKKVYEEKEEQKKIRMKMQEEEREIRAIEKAKDEAEKEEKEYLKELVKAKKELEKGHLTEKHELEQKIAELESRLANASEKKERAMSMAMQTKRGHVYIISNIGSFGENVYKIGMTRRLDPQDRVDELGDASVPFEFDVHGMIFSEDAPALENKLHEIFGEHTVNKVNTRKEFFNVSIHDIQKECNKYGLNVELTKVADARDYRESLKLKDNNPYKKTA